MTRATISTPLATERFLDAGPGERLREQLDRLHADREPVAGADPYQKIGGGLEIYCQLDFSERRVTDVAAVATAHRGYETLLPGRGLAEAGLVGSTASGICGGVHAATSAQCIEMALGIAPPPLSIVARNLLLCCQYFNDSAMHLFLLCGPDYSAAMVSATNPEIWSRAQRTPAAHAATHGYATIGAIMTDLDRSSGRLAAEAVAMMRTAREAYRLLGGKYPHSESICPGGVSFALDADQLDAVSRTLHPFIDYAKRSARLWDDLVEFLYEAEPAFRELGRAPATMIDFGQWDHEEHYDATYGNCDKWGEKRWATPGAVIDGKLITTSLSRLNVGLEEFVESSFHDPWEEPGLAADPTGGQLHQSHPWNKTIIRNPGKSGGYSWANSLAWNRRMFEVGVYARLYISALAGKVPASDFVESTGRSLQFHLPAGKLPAVQLEWTAPSVWNALERNRARAYSLSYTLAASLEGMRRAKAMLSRGEKRMATPFEIPTDGTRFGVGFGGAGRGLLAHWAVLRGGSIANYQIAVPSRINGAPRAPWGDLGPCERALLDSPIIETGRSDPAAFQGIDLVRVMQSFDPCMPCKLHLISEGTDVASIREVNTDGLI